jgi:hypothetical protein
LPANSSSRPCVASRTPCDISPGLPTLKAWSCIASHGAGGSGHALRAVMATSMVSPPRNVSSRVTLLDNVSHYDAFLCRSPHSHKIKAPSTVQEHIFRRAVECGSDFRQDANDVNERALDDLRAIPPVEDEHTVIPSLFFLPLFEDGARTSVRPCEMNFAGSTVSSINQTWKRPCQGAPIHCWSS